MDSAWSAHEREYSPSSCIPSIDDELERYVSASQAAATLPHRNVRYGDRPDEQVILFEGPTGAPLHVFVHGGYWQALSAADSLMPAPALVAAGHSFAAVDYTLAPEATVGVIIDQCVRAVECVVRELDPGTVTLSGSSAGAHLAAMVAQRASVRIDRLVLLSGMYQLAPLIGTTVNDALGLDASSAAAWSVPVTPRPSAQVVVLHGRNETAAFKAQSARLAAAWGVPSIEVDERNHFDLVHDLAAIDLRLGRPTKASADHDDDDHDDDHDRDHDRDGRAERSGEVPPDAVLIAGVERAGAPRRLSPDVLHAPVS